MKNADYSAGITNEEIGESILAARFALASTVFATAWTAYRKLPSN